MKSGAAADVGVWSSTAVEAESISAVGRALTKREEAEPPGRGSVKGSRAYGLGMVTGCWFDEGPGLGLGEGEGEGAAECKGLATMSSSRTWSSDVCRTRCFPPPSTEWCDERRVQSALARRATSPTIEEVEAEVSRAVFRRCRSATSHSLKFY